MCLGVRDYRAPVLVSTICFGRDVGAGHLCHLLSGNSSLAHLNVSNNCLTAKGAVVFADGIFKNDVIKSLQVTRDGCCHFYLVHAREVWLPLSLSTHACGAFSICLEQINSNPIGSDGARAIMRAMRKNDTEPRSIGMESCTLHNVVVFDPSSPAGTYSLDLSQAYDRVRTSSNRHPTRGRQCMLRSLLSASCASMAVVADCGTRAHSIGLGIEGHSFLWCPVRASGCCKATAAHRHAAEALHQNVASLTCFWGR
jgi:hypothetical protein